VTLRELFSGLEVTEWSGPEDCEVRGLAYRAEDVRPGDTFCTWKGLVSDGHRFVPSALANGASALVVEQPVPTNGQVPVVRVPSGRRTLAGLSSRWFGRPGNSLHLAGITGTNGKTSTAYLLHHILEGAGVSSGLLGTICYRSGSRAIPAPRTTPECLDLYRLLAGMRDDGCRAAVMEVSSHALEQERVAGLEFETAIFTNLTRDHLDYHGTMEKYFQAKARLFTGLSPGSHAVVNLDDPAGVRLAGMVAPGVRVHGYSLSEAAEHRAEAIRLTAEGTTFVWHSRGESREVSTPWVGSFNVANTLAAASAARAMGLGMEVVAGLLRTAPPVPGRLERVSGGDGYTVLVDYAHTDDALRQVLSTLRPLCTGRLLVLAGCGGDRDRTKRPLMAGAAVELADFSVFTSDNPRSEDPLAILAEMESGAAGRAPYQIIPDRSAAIAEIVGMARTGDVVVLAGKGHENTQEIRGERKHFSDVEEARKAMALRRGGRV